MSLRGFELRLRIRLAHAPGTSKPNLDFNNDTGANQRVLKLPSIPQIALHFKAGNIHVEIALR
jgi:hypothetical protein